MTKLICFDLWETLVNKPLTTEDCWEPLALAYPEKLSSSNVHELTRNILQRRKNQPTQASIHEVMKLLDVTDPIIEKEVSKLWNNSCDNVALFPETLEVLKDLRQSNFKLGLITNTSQYGWESIQKKFSLGNYFDFLSLSFEQEYVKPEPEIFAFIEKQSGIPNEEIAMVGDSYENDILSSRRRGWKGIFLDREHSNKHPEERLVIYTLRELKAIL